MANHYAPAQRAYIDCDIYASAITLLYRMMVRSYEGLWADHRYFHIDPCKSYSFQRGSSRCVRSYFLSEAMYSRVDSESQYRSRHRIAYEVMPINDHRRIRNTHDWIGVIGNITCTYTFRARSHSSSLQSHELNHFASCLG